MSDEYIFYEVRPLLRRSEGDVNMSFELKKEDLSVLKCVCNVCAEQSIDLELSLPDYCSDIKRILKCSVNPFVSSLSRSGERVSAEGEIVIRLVYVNNEEKTDCFEHKIALSKSAELKDASQDAVVVCSADTEYVNCRAASQRRCSLGGNVSISFKAYTLVKTQVLSQIENDGAQTLREENECVSAVACGEKCFDMSETASVDQKMQPIGKIIRSNSRAQLDSVKAVSGKLLLKGELLTDVLYCGDSSDGELQCLRHSMPISQIIEVPDVTEDTQCFVRLYVRSLSLQPRADSSGSNRLLEIAAKVCAFVEGYETKTVELIDDCYSTRCRMSSEFGQVNFLKKAHTFDSRETFRKTVELSGQNAKSVVDAKCVKTTANVSADGKKLELNLNLLVGILFVDDSGKIQYTERTVDYICRTTAARECKKIVCTPYVSVEEIEGVARTDSKIDLRVVFSAYFNVYSSEEKRICTSVCADEAPGEKDDSALIVCYCKKGERLWNIAKRYSTTLEAIKDENDLKGDETEEERILMVPCV